MQVPVVISDGKEIPGDAIRATQFLNISLHQSQVVTSPGFVVVYHSRDSIEVASYSSDGNVLPHRDVAFPDHKTGKEMRRMIVEG